jgi:hypothetical protein
MEEDKTIRYFCYFLALLLSFMLAYFIFKQVEHFEKQFDPQLNKLEQIFTNFFNQEKYWTGSLASLNNREIMKEITLYKGDKSYTINKEKVYMCLKDEKGQYYDLNLLTYVLAHELAHVICESVGHTPEFHEIFDQLLKELVNDGYYDPSQGVDPTYCEYGDNS